MNTFRGPQILGKVTNRNMGLQQYVASFPFWKNSVNGQPSQAHMEDHNIARMMQLEILAHSSPLEALRHRPSLEVGLRRLYGIIYAERQVAMGEMSDRRAAWQNMEFLLKSTPTDASMCDDIEEEMARRLTQSKRRLAATKAISESDPRRSRRGASGKGQESTHWVLPCWQQGSRRRTQNPEGDKKQE